MGGRASPHDLPAGLDAPASGTATIPPLAGVGALSDVLGRIRLEGALFFLVDISSPWCIEVPSARDFAGLILPRARHVVSYHIAVEGRGLATLPGQAPVTYSAGDVIVFPHADPYMMADGPGAEPLLDRTGTIGFFRDLAAGRLPFVIPEGGGSPPLGQLLCGFLGCDPMPFNPLFRTLPRLMHVPRPAGRPNDLLDRLTAIALDELRTERAGGQSVRLKLSELMFVEVLRRYLVAEHADEAPTWLAGLRDPLVGRALSLIHADPAADWTLGSLARAAGGSRTVLAERFARFVGAGPMHYLTLWRIERAAALLAEGEHKVAAVGAEVGFRSEAAFSRAFKRATGVPPSAWRDELAGGSPPHHRRAIA